MTAVGIGTGTLAVERSGAEGGPPLLLIMGMSGTALHWGEPFLGELRRGLRRDRLRSPRRRGEQPPGGPDHDRRDGRRRRRAPRGARAVLGACPGHLDGRDGRPGAGTVPARAGAHPDARLHLVRRPGARADRPGRVRADQRRDGLRRPRARDPDRLGGERVAGVRRRRAGLAALSRHRSRARCRGARRARPDAGVRGPRHAREAGRARDSHPRRSTARSTRCFRSATEGRSLR